MFSDAWAIRAKQAEACKHAAKQHRKSIDAQIDKLVSRIVDSEQDAIEAAYEIKIAQLEKDRVTWRGQSTQKAMPDTPFRGFIRTYLSIPRKPLGNMGKGLIKCASIGVKINLPKPDCYHPEKRYLKPDFIVTIQSFKVLAGQSRGDFEMARPGGLSSNHFVVSVLGYDEVAIDAVFEDLERIEDCFRAHQGGVRGPLP